MAQIPKWLSGDITATEVEKLTKKELILVAKELGAELPVESTCKSKAEIKATLLQALAEKNMLKSAVKRVEMTESFI